MKVVVAIDSEQSAQVAMDYIAAGKYDKETQIKLVHVLVPGFADSHYEGIPDVVAEETDMELLLLAKTAKSLAAKTGAQISSAILSGEAADTIAKACRDFGADEVIVPSHARNGFSRLWFGSLADEIVDAAPCTTIVLKMPVK